MTIFQFVYVCRPLSTLTRKRERLYLLLYWAHDFETSTKLKMHKNDKNYRTSDLNLKISALQSNRN